MRKKTHTKLIHIIIICIHFDEMCLFSCRQCLLGIGDHTVPSRTHTHKSLKRIKMLFTFKIYFRQFYAKRLRLGVSESFEIQFTSIQNGVACELRIIQIFPYCTKFYLFVHSNKSTQITKTISLTQQTWRDLSLSFIQTRNHSFFLIMQIMITVLNALC